MKPFDLSAALAGAPVCTRDGREVTQLVKFDCERGYCVFGVAEGGPVSVWYESGRCLESVESNNDIFMAPVKKTGWVARYAHDDGTTYINTTIFKDKATCVDICGDALSYHEISWEE
jgi:hypothetical protein